MRFFNLVAGVVVPAKRIENSRSFSSIQIYWKQK